MRFERHAEELRELVAKIQESKDRDRAIAIARLFQSEGFERPQLAESALVWLRLLQEQTLTGSDVEPYVPAILEIWEATSAEAIHLEPTDDWMRDDDYLKVRSFAAVLLDLLGYLPGDTALPHLRSAFSRRDAWIRMWALISLLRHGEQVEPADIEQVAKNNDARIVLWEHLRQFGMESQMPERWAQPEELAASALARWAAHPLELGAPPEEVQLMSRFPVEFDGAMLDVYLFRFREYPKPWIPGEGWMAAIAGPFRDGEQLISCWSSFDRWDLMSPEEHFEKLYRRPRACPVS